MIDPISIGLALSGIQKAVKMVKQASQTVDDVASLGPVLGNLFSAKEKAIQSVDAAKKSGNASNMSIAIQVEMALEQTRELESEMQMLFMQAGKVDVWNKIKERAGEMDKADKYAEQAAKDRAKKQKEEQEEFFIIAAIMVLVIVLGYVGYLFVQESIDYAKKNSHPVHHRN